MTVELYDYIEEQPVLLASMIQNSKQISESFVNLITSRKISKVILTGSGSSYNAAQSAKYFMQKLLHIQVDVQLAHSFYQYETVYDNETLVVGISQSGESTATVNSIKKANAWGIATLAVTSEEGSYITEHAAHTLIVPSGEEKVGATTKGYTATVLAFCLAAVEGAYAQQRIDEKTYRDYLERMTATVERLPLVIRKADQWFKQNRETLLAAETLIVSGYGNNYGTALEAGLKFLETSRIPVSVYELEEFMHGPYNAIDEKSFIFFIVPAGVGKERALRLNEYFSSKTQTSFIVTKEEEGYQGKQLGIPFIDDLDFTPLEYIVPLQVLFFRLAKERGVDMSQVRYPDFHGFMNSKRFFE
ncbi:SIS domain-containing protein [Brevibacillus fluminis]|uniref:SIS domain-containing protein n=1 Tax=Brevibacillus fluminis TaxID=511487 RepID=A0A3M8DSG8_9BACL|nr:SIS domain-containing protein [Brevibacillus fluminis]RNB90391.1 SIS domain-containing protein [Brevibacillus fluminis]